MNSEPSPPLPPWLELLDHTADTGIIVTADSLEELFSRAAWGLFSIITDVEMVRAVESDRIVVTATDRAALLVAWLSELNFRHVTRHQLFGRFEVRELTDTRLVAEVAGEPIAPGRHAIHTEIKAVTFHGLKLEPVNGGWRAQIIFDL